jgi:hypothetical protein
MVELNDAIEILHDIDEHRHDCLSASQFRADDLPVRIFRPAITVRLGILPPDGVDVPGMQLSDGAFSFDKPAHIAPCPSSPENSSILP